MKNLLLLFVAALTLASCDTDDDYSEYSYQYLATEEATIPENMVVGETYTITLNYIQPSSCDTFDSLYYYKNEENIDDEEGTAIETQVRTIAVISSYYENSNTDCEDLNEEKETSFVFAPEVSGLYLFKFWTGLDENGEDTFIEIEREVTE
ncbi:hypothetical protein [Formosa sp. L2A11]|uniref:hypothetical protein n=1 Tax=Formosa sp. L2A11 TaxID=2686363 RepID=UPI00131CC44B|nr:hypothetical protein [Formosa sp. L2A11]